MAVKKTARRPRKKQGRNPAGKLALYLLTIVGGTLLGVVAYGMVWDRQQPAGEAADRRRATSVPQARASNAAPPARRASRTVGSRSEQETPRRDRARSDRDEGERTEGERSGGRRLATDAPASGSGAGTDTEPRPEPVAAPATEVEPCPPIEVERGAGRRPEVALTFDAGADWKPVKQILAALAAEGVRSTFFLTGEWVQQNPKTARLIVEQGHEIGNHSWDHPAFTGLTNAQIQDQLRRTEAIIQETAGKSSRPFFRPPLGARDFRVRKAVGDEGFLTIYWSLDSRDAVDRGITAPQIQERVVGKSAAGSIVLLHCGSQATADAVPEILRGLKSRGLFPVTVGRLLQE
jgi:peptidoglycan/xylan/chitin deacetylase (PgdA/CDA1 family)